jgi:hypothetical protein
MALAKSIAIVVVLLITGRFAPAAADDTLPYLAHVGPGGASIRSGPGQAHYATDQLEEGATVEVHRHDPGGWCAIRPLDTSFCLVAASDVRPVEGDIAEIVAPTEAWVGTNLGAVDQPLWQVRLEPGERVVLLGVVDRQAHQLPDDSPDWVQIEPPSGEFRWVHCDELADHHWSDELPAAPADHVIRAADELALDPSPDGVASDGAAEPVDGEVILAVAQVAASQRTTDGRSEDYASAATNTGDNSAAHDEGPPLVDARGQAPPNDWPAYDPPDDGVSGWRRARQSVREVMPPNAEPTRLASASTAPGLPNIGTSAMPSAWPAPTIGSPLAAGMVTRGVAEIEIVLTSELAKPPDQWQLDGLAAQAQALVAGAADDLERQQAFHVLGKINRARQTQSALLAAFQGRAPSSERAAEPSRAAPLGDGPAADDWLADMTTADSPAHNYDASGVLNELVRDGGLGQTTYVLQDDTGRITHQITAAPGVNLQRYLKRRVGIVGQRGYNQQLRLDHVTADRVIVLDRHLR